MSITKENLQQYIRQNPNHLIPSKLAKLHDEIDKPRGSTISDEYLDFKLWCEGMPSRQESFANYIENELPVAKVKHILEVGGGVNGRLSRLLEERGYDMTCMDPALELDCAGDDYTGDAYAGSVSAGSPCSANPGDQPGIKLQKTSFDYRTTDLSGYDYVIAQEPCEASEHIVRACSAQRIPFIVLLCGVPHRLISGEMPEDVWAWYRYLEEIDPEHTVLEIVNLYGLVRTAVIRSKT